MKGRTAGVACLLAGGVFLFAAPRTARLDNSAFAAAGRQAPQAAAQPRAPVSGYSLCGSDGCARQGSLVAMKSQGQGGRNIFGDRPAHGQPKLKGAKKWAVLRPRKNYGSRSARQVPRRYPLYDILEEIDEKIPTYTVVSEPEEPLQPVLGVPLTERYPWAGDLSKVNKRKQEMEHGENEERMEPYFGSWTGAGLPPKGRRQLYVKRMGFPTYNYPPWLNKPLIGEEVHVPGKIPFKKHRTPKIWQYTKKKQREIRRAQREKDEAEGGADDDADDDVLEELED